MEGCLDQAEAPCGKLSANIIGRTEQSLFCQSPPKEKELPQAYWSNRSIDPANKRGSVCKTEADMFDVLIQDGGWTPWRRTPG
jgi:hypothetical protein